VYGITRVKPSSTLNASTLNAHLAVKPVAVKPVRAVADPTLLTRPFPMNAPLPANEAERLQALRDYDILDTPPEAAFERLTSLAARLFDMPIALVSLVDADRQWFKACFGVDLRETSRELSFCAYTILSDDVMVVPNAVDDPRFLSNAVVTGSAHIRFYAGAPLKTPSGQNLGSLCVVDSIPREFSSAQQALLADLAAVVVDELELRRTARGLREAAAALQKSESVLRQTLRENSQLTVAIGSLTSGVLITDPSLPDNPIIFANPGFYAITGYCAQEIIGRNCRFLQGPDTDRAMVQEIRDAIAERRPFAGVILNYRKDGTPFVDELAINPVFDDTGELLSFVGLQNDVTEREQSRQLLEQRVSERTSDLAQSQTEVLNRLARAAEFRDDDTGQHTQRVGRTTALLAQTLGMATEQVALIRQAAPLHDVGKIAISDLILLKPGRLTEEELAVMKTHAMVGATLLSGGSSEVVQMAERIAGSHHERWDGKGYPRQLAGEAIPLEARLLAVADVFDALTHERPYKKAWPVQDAVAEIARQSGEQFDPRVVEAFLTLPHETLI
jgi:PAS domain S-box-containing protein